MEQLECLLDRFFVLLQSFERLWFEHECLSSLFDLGLVDGFVWLVNIFGWLFDSLLCWYSCLPCLRWQLFDSLSTWHSFWHWLLVHNLVGVKANVFRFSHHLINNLSFGFGELARTGHGDRTFFCAILDSRLCKVIWSLTLGALVLAYLALRGQFLGSLSGYALRSPCPTCTLSTFILLLTDWQNFWCNDFLLWFNLQSRVLGLGWSFLTCKERTHGCLLFARWCGRFSVERLFCFVESGVRWTINVFRCVGAVEVKLVSHESVFKITN